MRYETWDIEGYTGAAIIRQKQEIFYAKLSIDLAGDGSLKRHAAFALYDDLLLSGTTSRDRTAFLDAVNKLGAQINVSIDHAVCTITLRARTERVVALLPLVSEMLQKPAFKEGEFKRVKQLVKNELIAYQEDARGQAYDRFSSRLFTRNDRRHVPLAEDLGAAIATCTRGEIVTVHRELMRRPWTVTVGSDAACIKELRHMLDKLKRTISVEPSRSAILAKPVGKVILLQHEVASRQNVEFSIGNVLPLHFGTRDYAAFNFGLAVLAKWGGFTGRLMSIVREKEGLTYGIYGRIETAQPQEYGYWRIMTFFAPADAQRGLDSTRREIARIHKHGITSQEYERFKTILATQQIMRRDSFTSNVDELHSYRRLGYALTEIEEIRSLATAVSRQEVNTALRAHLDPSTLVISVAGPVRAVQPRLHT